MKEAFKILLQDVKDSHHEVGYAEACEEIKEKLLRFKTVLKREKQDELVQLLNYMFSDEIHSPDKHNIDNLLTRFGDF